MRDSFLRRRRHRARLRDATACALAAVLLGATASTTDAAAPAREARDVPAPTATTSVVTVKTGGDRSGDQSVAPLAGVRLGLYRSATGGSPLDTCASDAQGDCSFQVTGTQSGGPESGARLWVRQVAAPDGWFSNAAFRTGGTANTPYRFQTPALHAGTTYRSTDSGPDGFMVSSGASNQAASGGTWQQSRDNPVLPEKCGLKVALVMDLSGSMNGSVPALKSAADTFVNSLQGTPSSMARFTFSDYSPATRGGANAPGLASVSTTADATAFKNTYASWTNATANGSTNWDRALYEPALVTEKYDLAVVITDGMPTRYGTPSGTGGNGSLTRLRELENGIFSANALKAQDTRVLAVGVGNGTSGNAGQNLASLSGPTKYDGSNIADADYFQEADFAGAGAALRRLALANCTPALSVVKQIRDQDGTLSNAPQGWTFDGSTTTAGVSVTSPRTTTADGTGAVSFPLRYDEAVPTADVAVTERQQSGYTLVQQSGRNATCYDKVSEQSVPVTDDPGGGPGFTAAVPFDGSVTCTVVNQAPAAVVPAQLQVDKEWSVTAGGETRTYANGEQPSDLQAGLRLSDTSGTGTSDASWSTPREGYRAGQQATVSETTRFGADLDCALTATDFDDVPLPAGDPSRQITLEAGLNRHRLTNHVTCHTTLRLAKSLPQGDADPHDWALKATGAGGALTGPEGTTGSPQAQAEVTPGARYQLSERLDSTGPELLTYAQVDKRTDYQSNPLSTGSMTCLAYGKSGEQLLGWSDGINGGVNVSLGLHAVCTAVNEAVPLTLVKKVEGGSAVPGDWDVTATPVEGEPAGVPARTVAGKDDPGTTVLVRPGRGYRIGESEGPAGYELTSVSCVIDSGDSGAGPVVTLASGQRGTCVLTNTYRPAKLTLVKNVRNEHGGRARPTDWTLSAKGPTPGVEGPTGDPAVTGAELAPGTYTLGEKGPEGYDAGAWDCREGDEELPVRDGRVTLTRGSTVRCALTNTDRAPSPTPTPTPTPTPKPTPTPAPGPSHHPGGGGGSLPDTGDQTLWIGAGAGLLLLLGAWLTLRARRRGFLGH